MSNLLKHDSHRRGSSNSTVRLVNEHENDSTRISKPQKSTNQVQASLWIHDVAFSTEEVLINDSLLEGSGIEEGCLLEVSAIKEISEVRDFQSPTNESENVRPDTEEDHRSFFGPNESPRYLCIAKFARPEIKAKQPNLQISIRRNISTAFGLRSRSQVMITAVDLEDWTSSHVELGFRDTYLSRSDMWRLVGQELAGKTVYIGQKITFLGSIRVVVKAIHVKGHKVSTAYFSGTTVPIFRSEAARYVLFIQMSREMWDFDSEGNGEILFNRVVNGFLPDLFKRWTDLEVRHLVSIVLFGRLEYNRYDFIGRKNQSGEINKSLSEINMGRDNYQDFYRVVVTDMASAQWTTILNELKRDFRVFLRDISLYPPREFEIHSRSDQAAKPAKTKITGQPSTAMKGNILEAMNIASSQFANDYIDRDLIRTGISVMVITAGAGLYEVDRDLLNLTSENLTNNGIGIDIVCLSKMPLHSVPLFKYRSSKMSDQSANEKDNHLSASPRMLNTANQVTSLSYNQGISPAASSIASNGSRYISGLASPLRYEDSQDWSYGIPHWIDLSYWSTESSNLRGQTWLDGMTTRENGSKLSKGPFIPRVRMYEVQMMGLMEMGMADIAIPFLSQSRTWQRHQQKHKDTESKSKGKFGSRSLSQSPKLFRKSISNSNKRRIPHQGLLSVQKHVLGDIVNQMDKFDDTVFRQPVQRRQINANSIQNKKSSQKVNEQQVPTKDTESSDIVQKSKLKVEVNMQQPKQAGQSSDTPTTPIPNQLSKKRPEAARAVRNVSYALRGLAPPLRAMASTEVNIENAQAQPLKSVSTKSRPTLPNSSGSVRSLSMYGPVGDATGSHGQEQSTAGEVNTGKADKPAMPILIGAPNGHPHDTQTPANKSQTVLPKDIQSTSIGKNQHIRNSEETENRSGSSSEDDLSETLDEGESILDSISPSTLPFIRNVNASNPLKRSGNRASYFGRWQHLYPRKPRAATVKWRSLCTPASVPLTTEDFPEKDELDTEYDITTYDVRLANINEMQEVPETRDTLLREMLSLRFAHGYQLVVGSRMLKSVGPGSCDPSYFFLPDYIRPNGQFLYMSMGNTIQKLSLEEADRIGVTKYIRKSKHAGRSYPTHLPYEPHIRTILSEDYVIRSMGLKGYSEQYPWEKADKYLADGRKEFEDEVTLLRFWRARFVLLPVEPPTNARRLAPSDSEENEEEIHLRGIRALTQMWQKSRFIPPEERRPAQNRINANKRKDRNPLRVLFDTLNPSELVSNALAETELDNLLETEEGGEVQTTQLLPEEEQFERVTASLTKLASAIQGEKGIKIKNRRWHLRLHYYCFEGEELTNWLVHNFRDIDTREEAVDFGNELMNDGLFEHVNSRHNFKDGNFFYSIKPDWRLRADNRQSWFPGSRRSDRSIPPTPITENLPKDSPLSARTRSGSNLANQSTPQTSELTKVIGEKKRVVVSLSKTIRIDVDTRKRSNRPEVVNLHYDRLHNPENCYHLELSWLNVTSKLVDDAIVSWTGQAEKYGLKLVEVPIVEASEVSKYEPFRSPYLVKFALEPPQRQLNGNKFFTATSFEPQTPVKSDVHIYQKALLKKFNFVLDLEAVSEFPENVEIQYSLGKLEYRYTQFIHRSGVILAQITDEGNFLLLMNRLYNSRFASTKDTTSKFDNKKESGHQNIRPSTIPPPPPPPPSGVLGLNVQSPSPVPSPLMRASPDIRKITPSIYPSYHTTYITPEQIKDDLENFCQDKEKLELFYREVTTAPPITTTTSTISTSTQVRKSGSTSSSLLRPIREPDPHIPEFKLPDSISIPKRKSTS